MQIAGIDKKLASPIGRLVFSTHATKGLGQAWARAIMQWDFEHVCCCHLAPAVPQGKEQFARCFDFLLKEA